METKAITEQDINKFKKILHKIKKMSIAYDFLIPVDYKTLGLFDYIKIIKKPMDISTVESKLNNGLYTDVNQVIEDIQLIWDNCKKYNIESSNIYKWADELEKLSDDSIKIYFPLPRKKKLDDSDYNINKMDEIAFNQPTNNGNVSHFSKIQLSKSIKGLNSEKLHKFVKYLNEKCAFLLKETTSGYDLDLEKINQEEYDLINSFLIN